MKDHIYLDNSATTRVDDDILQASMPYFNTYYGNPSSIHKGGRQSRKAIDIARESIAHLIGASPKEIYFTSGGTEADNWVLKNTLTKEKKTLITSKIEHHAVLHTCQDLSRLGYTIQYVDVDSHAMIQPETLKKSMTDDTALVSIMSANNEVGSIQDIQTLCHIAHEKGSYFHTDAVQALGKYPINVKETDVDFMSLSGHKIHAFKGIGALYIKKSIKLPPFILGGEQELGLRAGTENVPAIVSFGLACKKLEDNFKENVKIQELRDLLIDSVLKNIPCAILTGAPNNRLINHASFCFKNLDSSMLLILLDKAGICVSAGSACMSGSIQASHVLTAMQIDPSYLKGNLRISLSKYTTKEDIDYTVKTLIEIVEKLQG